MRIDLTDVVGPRLSNFFSSKSLELDMRPVSDEEMSTFVDAVKGFQKSKPHVQAGEHRLNDWANGWAENFAAFSDTGDVGRLIPKYFGKYPEVRLGGRVFVDSSGNAELALLRALQTCALAYAKQIAPFETICEFGAGTGHNLLHFGADKAIRFLRGYEWSWSGVACVNEIGKRLDSRISGRFFDYYAPGLALCSDLANCCIVTVASMEQIGGNFRPFLEFLKLARPNVVVNIEPVQELMGSGTIADLSREYAHDRNYLAGYYNYLKNLHRAGVIEILLEQDSLIGSKFLNGYGTMVWRWIY
jgi:hypothetical protein